MSAVRRAADEATVLRLETATYTVPTDAPEADGTLAWDSTTLVVVHAFAADGTTGLGWTYAGRACQTLIDDQLTGSVLGRSALDVPGCLEAMVRACRNLGRPGVVSCAIAAVELAMWDLKARLLGLPLCRLLGQVHEQVPVYGSGGFTSYDDAQLRPQLELWTQELRIPRVKIKIGESWGACEQRDLARVRQAREVVGPDVALYVDANGGYSPAQAMRVPQHAMPSPWCTCSREMPASASACSIACVLCDGVFHLPNWSLCSASWILVAPSVRATRIFPISAARLK